MKKKMRITPQRLAELKQPNACYLIHCSKTYGLCDNGEKSCEVGFFSHFLRALYGIRFAIRYKLPYYVDYGSVPHAYTDLEKFSGDRNFWNHYFKQRKPCIANSEKGVVSLPYETFPLRIWNRSFLEKMGHIAKEHLILQPYAQQLIERKKKAFSQNKVIGVHIRRTDHHLAIEPVPLSVFIQTLKSQLHQYEKIFIATDDEPTLDRMNKEFGDRIIYNEIDRSTDGRPLHYRRSTAEQYKLGLGALVDAYCLSFCQKAILVHSNLSYAALLLNPFMPYVLLETRKHQLMRYKTLGTYFFDYMTTWLPTYD